MSTIKTQSVANAKKEISKSTCQNSKSPKVVTNITPQALDIAFFSVPEIKKELHLQEIKTLKGEIDLLTKKEFSKSMDVAKIIAKVQTWWKNEGKEKAKAFGMKADQNTIPSKYGYTHQWWGVYAKAGSIPDDVVADFTAQCETSKVNPSLEKLVDFFNKSVGKGKHEGSEGEGEGEGEGEDKKVQTIFTLSYKTENGNVSVRVDNLGKVTTSNTKEDIKNALIFLSTHIVSLEK
jgi:hypothetical protein